MDIMNAKKILKIITAFLSVLLGAVFYVLLSETDHFYAIQLGILGFIIGASTVWLVYLAIWFLSTGFKRTAFPVQSAAVVAYIKKYFLTDIDEDKEKLLIEVAGTIIMIGIGFGLLTAGYFVVNGILFIAGKFHW